MVDQGSSKKQKRSASSTSASRATKRPASPFEEDDEPDLQEEEEEEDDNGEDDEHEPRAESSTASARRAAKKPKKSNSRTAGIVYISRVPPGMTPQKIRHLMDRWGEVGKVYAQRRDAPTGYNPNSSNQKKQKHQKADFTEAWVEFLDKSVAKMVARMMNAQVIGGKKGDRWRDDIWTMKYLSGFKWEMLGEQVAYEKQSHQARLRNEITRSKTEQGEYLRNVELARVLEKRKQKKIAAGKGDEAAEGDKGTTTAGGDAKSGDERKSGYRQRQAVDRTQAHKGTGMDGVLGSVFG